MDSYVVMMVVLAVLYYVLVSKEERLKHIEHQRELQRGGFSILGRLFAVFFRKRL